MELWDTDSDNENDTGFSYGLSDFGSGSDSSDPDFYGIPEFLDSGRKSWTLDSGRWTLDAVLWTVDAGLWMLDSDATKC